MRGWDKKTAMAAPIGLGSALTLAAVAVCGLVFRLFSQSPFAPIAGWIAGLFIPAAYLLFAPAVAGSLYSILFERSKAFGLAGLGLAGLTLLMAQIFADGLLLLPFWFLAIMGSVKFVRWQGEQNSGGRT